MGIPTCSGSHSPARRIQSCSSCTRVATTFDDIRVSLHCRLTGATTCPGKHRLQTGLPFPRHRGTVTRRTDDPGVSSKYRQGRRAFVQYYMVYQVLVRLLHQGRVLKPKDRVRDFSRSRGSFSFSVARIRRRRRSTRYIAGIRNRVGFSSREIPLRRFH